MSGQTSRLTNGGSTRGQTTKQTNIRMMIARSQKTHFNSDLRKLKITCSQTHTPTRMTDISCRWNLTQMHETNHDARRRKRNPQQSNHKRQMLTWAHNPGTDLKCWYNPWDIAFSKDRLTNTLAWEIDLSTFILFLLNVSLGPRPPKSPCVPSGCRPRSPAPTHSFYERTSCSIAIAQVLFLYKACSVQYRLCLMITDL